METKDPYLVDIFDPCNGFTKDAYDNTGTEEMVTCVGCLASSFVDRCAHMNLEAIKKLGEDDLADHFVDHEALSIFHERYDL